MATRAGADRFEQAVEMLCEHIRGQKLRLTSERLALLRAVLNHPGHFDADAIAAKLHRRRGSAASRATVYRTLVLLEECGIVRQSHIGQGHTFYENALDRRSHDHIVCASCGRVEEFYEERVERLQDEIAGRLGFRVTKRIHEILGLCAECARGEKGAALRKQAGRKD